MPLAKAQSSLRFLLEPFGTIFTSPLQLFLIGHVFDGSERT